MSFKEWAKYSLKDAASKIGDGLHGTPKYDDFGECYFINGSNLIDGAININQNTKKVSNEEFNKHKKELNDRSILLSINGTIGNIALYKNEKCILGKSACYINVADNFDKLFIKYVLQNNHFQSFIKSNASGTTIKNVNLGLIREYEFEAPSDINIQRKMSSILSSIEDKIELNRQTNKTLEELVKTFFQEMCVSKNIELEEGWQLLKLEKFIVLKNGYAFKGMDFIEEGVPVIKIKNVKAGKVILNQLSYVSREVADKAQRFRIKQNDLLITMSGNRIDGTPETWVGKVGIFHRDGEFLLNQRVSILNIIDENKMSKYFLTQLLSSDEYQYYFISNATSSGGQANISPDLIYNTEIVVPPIEQLQKFNKMAKDIYNKIFANELEIETLTNLRDNLLPKLMKGEISL